MNKVQSREQTTIFDTHRECSSSACSMNEVDPSYLGYWSSAEVAVFLKSLLEQERIGTKAFADIGYAADLRVADLILESELGQGSICILLENEIAKKGAVVPTRHKRLTHERRIKITLEQAVASARSNQADLLQTIEDALRNIFDSELKSLLVTVLRFHRKHIAQLESLRA
jgi:hypothetical protein